MNCPVCSVEDLREALKNGSKETPQRVMQEVTMASVFGRHGGIIGEIIGEAGAGTRWFQCRRCGATLMGT